VIIIKGGEAQNRHHIMHTRKNNMLAFNKKIFSKSSSPDSAFGKLICVSLPKPIFGNICRKFANIVLSSAAALPGSAAAAGIPQAYARSGEHRQYHPSHRPGS
jgi:hypothetical protein